ncbi:hypothetical protein CR513_51266, partial [Mucuna pruriens]
SNYVERTKSWVPLSRKPNNLKKEGLVEQEKGNSLILLSLLDEVSYEVAEEQTDVVLWLKLKKLYMTRDTSMCCWEEDVIATSVKRITKS